MGPANVALLLSFQTEPAVCQGTKLDPKSLACVKAGNWTRSLLFSFWQQFPFLSRPAHLALLRCLQTNPVVCQGRTLDPKILAFLVSLQKIPRLSGPDVWWQTFLLSQLNLCFQTNAMVDLGRETGNIVNSRIWGTRCTDSKTRPTPLEGKTTHFSK